MATTVIIIVTIIIVLIDFPTLWKERHQKRNELWMFLVLLLLGVASQIALIHDVLPNPMDYIATWTGTKK